MRLEHKVKGFDEFDRLLKQLPRTVENRILQDATRDTLKETVWQPMKEAAPRHKDDRSPASKQYGTLRSNIRVRALKSKRKNERGASISTGMAFWGWILEKGSRYIPAMPWFLPTFNMKREPMINTLGKKIGEGIEREAERSYRGGR